MKNGQRWPSLDGWPGWCRYDLYSVLAGVAVAWVLYPVVITVTGVGWHLWPTAGAVIGPPIVITVGAVRWARYRSRRWGR